MAAYCAITADELLKRQRYVTGLKDTISDGRYTTQLRAKHVVKAFRSRFGESSVVHARVKYWKPRQGDVEVVGAVVEFKDAKTAELVSREEDMLAMHGCEWKDLVLQMNDIGGLRAASAADTNSYVR